MYWVAISSKTPTEKEEKWKSLANHIAAVHVHEENKVFTKCTHKVIERDWLKQGIEPQINKELKSNKKLNPSLTV